MENGLFLCVLPFFHSREKIVYNFVHGRLWITFPEKSFEFQGAQTYPPPKTAILSTGCSRFIDR
jgi:hypothetical protein